MIENNNTKHIIIIETRIPERTVLQSILSRLGYKVTVSDTLENIDSIIKDTTNLIIINSAIKGANEWALSRGQKNCRILLLDQLEDQKANIAGFIDATEHVLRGINVRVPEIVMMVNDFISVKGSAVKRKPRIAGGYKVTVTIPELQKKLAGHIFNLSSTGAFVELMSPPAKGTNVKIDFDIPEFDKHFSADAVISWRVLSDESSIMRSPPGCGLYFKNLSLADQQFIDNFVEHKGRK